MNLLCIIPIFTTHQGISGNLGIESCIHQNASIYRVNVIAWLSFHHSILIIDYVVRNSFPHTGSKLSSDMQDKNVPALFPSISMLLYIISENCTAQLGGRVKLTNQIFFYIVVWVLRHCHVWWATWGRVFGCRGLLSTPEPQVCLRLMVKIWSKFFSIFYSNLFCG